MFSGAGQSCCTSTHSHAKPPDRLAGPAQHGVIQGIGNTDIGPQAKGAAMHHGYTGFVEQGQGHVFIGGQHPACGRGAADQSGASGERVEGACRAGAFKARYAVELFDHQIAALLERGTAGVDKVLGAFQSGESGLLRD